jgi:hypothetical protein
MPTRATLHTVALIGMLFTAFLATALLVRNMNTSASRHGEETPNRGGPSQITRGD